MSGPVFELTDIGAPLPGSVSGSIPGPITVTGDGSDIWDNVDHFSYYHDTWSGNFVAIAQVVSQQNTDGWAKGGIMARATTDAGSMHANVSATPSNTIHAQWRDSTDGGSGDVGLGGSPPNSGSAPYWIKLKRVGNDFMSYWAPDVGGTAGAWSAPTTHTVGAMPTDVELGLHVTSHNGGTTSAVQFNHVTFGVPATPTGLVYALPPTEPTRSAVWGKAYATDGTNVQGPVHWKVEQLVKTVGAGVRMQWFGNETWTGPALYDTLVPNINRNSNEYTGTPLGGDQNNFSIIYSGQIHLDHAGNFSFQEQVDDEARFYLDLNQDHVFQNGPGQPERILYDGGWDNNTTATVAVPAAGWYDFEFWQREGGGGDNCRLLWDPAGGSSYVAVPQSMLRAFGTVPELLAEGWGNVGSPTEDGYFGFILAKPEDYLLRLTVDYLGDTFVYDNPQAFLGVPEPGTMSLLGLGLLALARRRRRR